MTTQQYQYVDQTDQFMNERLQAQQRITTDMANLAQIGQELNTLVHQQAEQIDNIEDHIDQADEEVQNGVQQLETAAESKVSARKKQIFCSIYLGICIIIGTLIFVNGLFNWMDFMFGLFIGLAIIVALGIWVLWELCAENFRGGRARAAATAAGVV